jgi:hypothetical protein
MARKAGVDVGRHAGSAAKRRASVLHATESDSRHRGTWLDRNGSPFGSVSPANAFTIQSLDTRVPTGTPNTGVSASIATAGQYTITSDTGWNATPCNLIPTLIHAPPFVVNVVACKPVWNINPNPTTPNVMHVPQGNITLYIPPNFWSTLVGAGGGGPAVLASTIGIQAVWNRSSHQYRQCRLRIRSQLH